MSWFIGTELLSLYSMIVGVNLCCKNSINLERAEKIRERNEICTLRKHSHALIA